jgi:hypothetical protein
VKDLFKKSVFIGIILSMMFICAVPAFAANVTSPGLFTDATTDPLQACDPAKAAMIENDYNTADPSKPDTTNITETNPSFGTKILSGAGSDALKPTTKLFTDCTQEFSISRNFLKITSPINITDNAVVMRLVSITRIIAFAIALVLIVIFGLMFTGGVVGLDPAKFLIRLMFVFLSVYYSPYLMQDVLNLNNILVSSLSNISWRGGEPVNTALAIMTAFGQLWTKYMAIPGMGLIIVVMLLIILFYSIKPMIEIIVWWYKRLISVFFLCIIGPIFIVFIALPVTAGLGTKWIRQFAGEVFQQLFMVLALSLFAGMLQNIASITKALDIGWLGTFILIYAMFHFLAEVPKISKDLIGGANFSMGNMISGFSKMGESTKRFAQAGYKQAGENHRENQRSKNPEASAQRDADTSKRNFDRREWGAGEGKNKSRGK